MNNLNEAQKQAVTCTEGPLLVLAGAGTGKTKVLTERIINIINSYLSDPRQILAVTFTNKAAAEMKHRIFSAIGENANNIWMGTFHGIAARILKRHPEIVGLKSDFTIIDADDALRLLKQITAELNIDHKEYPPKNYLYQIERLKDKAISAENFENDESFGTLPKLSQVYRNYQERLKSLNAADFGDLLFYNLEIFKKSPPTLSYYQDKFHYILVDEYQDTNNAQYQWLLRLSGKYKNICAVGDDDQSIYSWRGAQIANILRFEKDFPGTKIIRLERNYRSSGHILKAASHLIGHNKERHGKVLWTDIGDGEKVKLFTYLSDREEAANIVYGIKNLQREGHKLNDIAILVRAGYQTRSFEEAFMQSSVPYRIIGGLKFYERKEIKDAIAYLRGVYNASDDLALERIINLPKRGVGDATINNLFEKAKSEKISLFASIKKSLEQNLLKGKAKEALRELTDKIEKWVEDLKNNSLSFVTAQMLEESGYLAMWKNEKTPDAEGRVENLREFVSSLEEFENLAAFLEHVSLVAGDEKINHSIDMVNIMTVHSAKGLEFETVFVPGLEEGVFPSGRAIEERNGIEEERRLFYVAITRAKKNLYLSFAQNRLVFGNFQAGIMSRFLKELPEEAMEGNASGSSSLEDETIKNFLNYSKEAKSLSAPSEHSFLNKRVFHQKFGYGKVASIDGDKLHITFEKAGNKVVMRSFVEIE